MKASDTKGRLHIADLPDHGGDALALSRDGKRLYIDGLENYGWELRRLPQV